MATTEHSDLEQQIIKTAQQLFIEKGFVETSMSDIAATVGINRPTLHYYFRTKDKMFKAVFGSIVMSLMPKIQDIVKQDIPFMERLSMILDEYIELFTSNPCLPRFICGEIQRDVNHLLATAKELQFGDALSQVKDSILTAMDSSSRFSSRNDGIISDTYCISDCLQPIELSISCQEPDSIFILGR